MCIEKDFLNISQGNNCYIDADAISTDGLFRRHHSSTAALCDVFIFINIDEQKSRVDTCMYLANLERCTSSSSRLSYMSCIGQVLVLLVNC